MKQASFDVSPKKPDIEVNKPAKAKFWQRPDMNLVLYLLFLAAMFYLWQISAKVEHQEIPYSQFLDTGTQYRSAIYTFDEQKQAALASREVYEKRLRAAGFGPITTEIRDAPVFYYAEADHQQYLAKNRGGYCGHCVSCPAGVLEEPG